MVTQRTTEKTQRTTEDVLPNAMIRDILVANPQAAKSDPLLDKLEERTIPMPDYMWAEIMQGEGIVEAKENLEAKVNHWNHKRYFHWNNLFRIFINEPENVSFIDSLFLLLQIEPAPAAKYELAFQHLENGDYSAANSVITQIPSQFQLEPDQQEDWQAMTSYLSSLNTLFSSNPITLYPESGLAAVFSALMTGSGNQASAYARNVLINAGLTTYNEPILLNESIKIGRKKRFREGGSNMISSNSCLRVFPNPAGDYFIAETHLEYENSAGILRIIDLTGQKILQYNIRYKDDQTVISTRDLTTGFYIVQLIEGKKVFAVTKIEIQ